MSKLMSIKFEKYSATICTLGGALYDLKYDSRNLIEPKSEPDYFFGANLVPWANRIRDGRYSHNGLHYQADKNEDSRETALHGLVYQNLWSVLKYDVNKVSLETFIYPSHEFPCELKVVVSYSLSKNGLQWSITATNLSEVSAPYSVSIHPYLYAGHALTTNDFILKFPASYYLEVDPDRLLPTSIKKCVPSWDFSQGALIDILEIDHAFLIDQDSDYRRVEVTDSTGLGTFMDFDENAKWIQIHTADRGGNISGRKSLAVEPMTSPPDAFNSKIDLIEIEPGKSFSMSWIIGNLAPANP